MTDQRRQGADGVASRAAILDAAAQVAGELQLIGQAVLGAARSTGWQAPLRPDEAEHRGAGV